ncbi:MAG TPA: hypothetical protein PL048_02385 [Leptospiraceae bacterium]|nr:hypothetical protein [Leptospiraceae bacterium]HMY66702.1 hypothetical protein [Leptospiraceae bacterium]HMZ57593.1 hypothetical protein [Leptospiraceae bacterium]HNF12602.1 hypothetical protein [Leptospiraceae bacterium]HNF24078.1 hypothetical protein [Leptospiraceae bacterium]
MNPQNLDYIRYLLDLCDALLEKEEILQRDTDSFNREVILVKDNIPPKEIPEIETVQQIMIKESFLKKGLNIFTWIQFFSVKLLSRMLYGDIEKTEILKDQLREIRNQLSHILFKYQGRSS